MNAADQIEVRYKCPACGYRVGFLPPDLALTCPKCQRVQAKDFIFKAGAVGWLNEGCPGWADEEPQRGGEPWDG